jgi:ATP/maltotriose-dependent transcriptional regulator MalT
MPCPRGPPRPLSVPGARSPASPTARAAAILRLLGELCEIRDLHFSPAESCDLLANFGVAAAAELALLHERSEGRAAVLQMTALTLRGTRDQVQAARALDVRSHAIAEYFIGDWSSSRRRWRGSCSTPLCWTS